MAKITYSNTILKAFEYLMKNDKNVFLIVKGYGAHGMLEIQCGI